MRRLWLLALGLVVAAGAALIPVGSGADHGSAINNSKGFDGTVTPLVIPVTCAAGATTGTASVLVSASHPLIGNVGDGNTGTGGADRIIVTWAGGTGSVTLTSFNGATNTPSGATFPCPATSLTNASGTFTFQPNKNGTTNLGTADTVTVTYQRVGSAS